MSNVYSVLSFSGGKDSTALLFWLLENKVRLDEVIFVDLGKEHEEVYDTITEISRKVFPVTVLHADFDYYMVERVKTKGKRAGERGYGWPDFHNRWCTALKRELISKHLREKKFSINYVGIAANEAVRARGGRYKKVEYRYPLVDANLTEIDAFNIAIRNGISWGGFYDKFTRASCWCCPFSTVDNLRSLYRYKPELWKSLLEMGSFASNPFSKNHNLTSLTDRFLREDLCYE